MNHDEIIDMAVEEMGWRLEDNERRSQIPDHVLIKLVDLANKAAERRAAERNPDGPEKSVLDIVRSSSLPPERKHLLIVNEIKRLDLLKAELEAELDG